MNASYLYYQASQGGMDLGIPVLATITDGYCNSGTYTWNPFNESVLVQDYSYKSGFQVGLGYICPNDNWVLYAEYSWIHGTTHTSETAPNADNSSFNGNSIPQTGLWYTSIWLYDYDNDFLANKISSKWNYKIDLVDAQVSRPLYSGKRLTFEPSFGLRGAFIRQNLDIDFDLTGASLEDHILSDSDAHYSSHSNGVGPRVRINGNWYLGYGVRFIGDAAASLLFTGYSVSMNVESTYLNYPTPVIYHIKDFNTLRPNIDLSLGLGWDAYFCNQRLHWNIQALYDVSIFFEQNMMRYLADTVNGYSSGGAVSNLYLEGLVVKTGFNF